MRKKGRMIMYISIALALFIVLAMVFLTLKRDVNEQTVETVKVAPSLEQELIERDRAILKSRIVAAFWEGDEKWQTREWQSPGGMERDSIDEIDTSLIVKKEDAHVPADDESMRPLVSPDGLKYVELAGGADEGEPDTELYLIDAAKKERQRLLFYGPSTQIVGAAWVDNGTIVVFGVSAEEDTSGSAIAQPLVWIFHLEHRLVTTYTTVEVDE